MAQKDPSRTEKASPKRINKARKEGNVPRSAEVGKTISVLFGFISLCLLITWMGHQIQSLMRHYLMHSYEFDTTPNNINSMFQSIVFIFAKLILPTMMMILLGVIIVTRLQVGKLWTTKVFKPKLARFNIIAGIKRTFISPQVLIRLLKSLMQALVIGIAPYIIIRSEWDTFINLYYTDATTLAAYILKTGGRMFFYALIPMLLIAMIDLIYTRWKYKEDLKMTKSEVKDELKQAEGDPKIKNKQRQKMMEVMSRRMMQNVPKADVVITNPTHIAVALKYDAMEAPAPVVVAKGAGLIAERIKKIAREANVPIKENKPLARALYKSVEIGDMIPEELYQAVAAVLASLLKFKKRPEVKVNSHH